MRILITSIPQVSHLFPMVPQGQALQAAGHDILVLTQPNVAPSLATAGLPARVAGAAFDMVGFFQVTVPAGTLPAEAWQFDLDRMNELAARPWSHWAREAIGPLLEVAASWQPDLIIGDPMAITARFLGGALCVPVVEHRWGPDTTRGSYHAVAARRMASLLRRHGLAGLPEPALVLDPCPPSIQPPGTVPGRPVRYVPYNGTGELPAGALAGSRPRVCVSFGRVVGSATRGALVRSTVEALEQLGGVTTTLAVTRNDLAEIGPVAGQAEILHDVPLNLLTSHCDVLVHHGGSGTGMTGLCAGLPQVILPQLPDQALFGRLLEDAGAGRVLADASAQQSVAAIAAAVGSVLNDPGYHAAARRLQAEIESMPEPAALVAELARLSQGEFRCG